MVYRSNDSRNSRTSVSLLGEHLFKKATASSDDAGFLEAEITIPARCGSADNDVIHQLELEDSASLQNFSGEAHISLRRGWIAARMVVHQDERVSGVRDHRLKDFSWVAERFIDTALVMVNLFPSRSSWHL